MGGTSSYSNITSKWDNVIDSILGTSSNTPKKSWLSQYVNLHNMNVNNIGQTTSCSSTATGSSFIFPMSMQVASKTIGLNLVSVKPMSGPPPTLSYLDYIYNYKEIYNSLFEMIDRISPKDLSILYKIDIKENLIQIEFPKEKSEVNFHDISYVEESENNNTYIYKISFKNYTTTKHANNCEYDIVEKVECDWKTYMRDKKIDGILD